MAVQSTSSQPPARARWERRPKGGKTHDRRECGPEVVTSCADEAPTRGVQTGRRAERAALVLTYFHISTLALNIPIFGLLMSIDGLIRSNLNTYVRQ